MGLRPSSCYRKVHRAYTRKSKFTKESFVKSIPPLKITRFNLGNTKKKFPITVNLISKEHIQVRQNALESARVVVVRKLSEKLKDNYHFEIRVYPHHVLRENKMISGAGADRMQTGMQKSFGKTIGLAAQLRPNQPIFSIHIENDAIEIAKESLKAAMPRLSCKCGIELLAPKP